MCAKNGLLFKRMDLAAKISNLSMAFSAALLQLPRLEKFVPNAFDN